MTSLSDVYKGGVRTVVDRQRRLFATTVFFAGVAMCGVAIVLTTTGLRSWAGLDVEGARRVAGILAGLGLPTAMVGVFTALPASDETRAAAVIGASVSVFGVLLFVYAYPEQWLTNEPALAISTVAVYTLGVLVTFWCLFVAVATFNRRGDPGGTARVKITDEGTVELVSRGTEEESSSTSGVPSVPGLGGIGLVGSDPAGDVPTQTNSSDGQRAPGDTDTDPVNTVRTTERGGDSVAEPASSSDATRGSGDSHDPHAGPGQQGSSARTDTGRGRGVEDVSARESGPTTGGQGSGTTGRPETTSNGGQSVTQTGVTEALAGSNGQPDAYCGNCAYFEYAGDAEELDPYCRYHRESMEDLEPCEQWTANTTDQ